MDGARQNGCIPRRNIEGKLRPMARTPPGTRADYRFFHAITTRWHDNDAFGHVNNVIYFAYFDTAVTFFEIDRKIAALLDGPIQCMVAEVCCRYIRPIAFPDQVTVGVRVREIGRTSVRYELGVFRNDEESAAAEGHFVHVFVDAKTQRPVPIGAEVRELLLGIAV